jgi:hypothetical protein
MSQLLWLITDASSPKYWYVNTPCIKKELSLTNATCLGTSYSIANTLKAFSFNAAFRYRNIQYEPAKWAAYFIFIGREVKVKLDKSEEVFLMELLESVDPKIWVQNRDIVDLLLGGLIKYSMRL